VSTTDSTSNGHHAPNSSAAPAASLAAFRAFLEAERPTLVAELARESQERIPLYHTMSWEEIVQITDDVIGVYINALDDCEKMAAWAEPGMRPLVQQGRDMAPLLTSIECYRQQLINVSLRALEAGIEGAADGLRALMKTADVAVRVVLELYHERMRLFQMVVQNAPDGIGVSNLDGVQIYPNPAFRELLGYGDELVGMHFNEYLENVDPEVMRQIGETGQWQGINTYRRKDGSSITCLSTIFIIPDDEGRPMALGGFIRDISDRLQAEQELKRQATELRAFFALAENAPNAILVANIDGVINYANQATRTLLGYDTAMTDVQITDHVAASPEQFTDMAAQIASKGMWSGLLDYRRRDGEVVQCYASSFLIRASDNSPAVIASIINDMTDQLRVEQERMGLQEQVIQAQQVALRELSTPLMPLADGIVAMPLIGTIDSRRAQQVIEELLQGVSDNRAATAIIDITGVPVVDTQVAGALLRAAQAVELLGARVILTGIRPEVAQTLVGIGVNLGSIVTRSTLQDGIAYALGTAKKR
jgi:rsbT co-antagonist protein RsbR